MLCDIILKNYSTEPAAMINELFAPISTKYGYSFYLISTAVSYLHQKGHETFLTIYCSPIQFYKKGRLDFDANFRATFKLTETGFQLTAIDTDNEFIKDLICELNTTAVATEPNEASKEHEETFEDRFSDAVLDACEWEGDDKVWGKFYPKNPEELAKVQKEDLKRKYAKIHKDEKQAREDATKYRKKLKVVYALGAFLFCLVVPVVLAWRHHRKHKRAVAHHKFITAMKNKIAARHNTELGLLREVGARDNHFEARKHTIAKKVIEAEQAARLPKKSMASHNIKIFNSVTGVAHQFWATCSQHCYRPKMQLDEERNNVESIISPPIPAIAG